MVLHKNALHRAEAVIIGFLILTIVRASNLRQSQVLVVKNGSFRYQRAKQYVLVLMSFAVPVSAGHCCVFCFFGPVKCPPIPAAVSARIYSLTRLSRNALVTTDTELIAIAAPANIGESSSPKAG
ncbi:hypothetical protein SAMN05216428_104208 [Nitrosospira sp. Nsp11]|nr:hypothetical protein SAMN05216428_104208 [Nitrosospira sp. Nsp11]